MDIKNLKKKIWEPKVSRLLPNLCDLHKKIHRLGYGFKNLWKTIGLPMDFYFLWFPSLHTVKKPEGSWRGPAWWVPGFFCSYISRCSFIVVHFPNHENIYLFLIYLIGFYIGTIMHDSQSKERLRVNLQTSLINMYFVIVHTKLLTPMLGVRISSWCVCSAYALCNPDLYAQWVHKGPCMHVMKSIFLIIFNKCLKKAKLWKIIIDTNKWSQKINFKKLIFSPKLKKKTSLKIDWSYAYETLHSWINP